MFSSLIQTNGIAVGNFGTIIRTTNGGANWNYISNGIVDNVRKVYYTDLNKGTAVCDNGIILHTTDQGTTWTQQTSGTSDGLNGISFADANYRNYNW